MSDIFAPDGGWRVRIRDLSGGAEDGISEEIGGFPTLMQANEFARRYVRDSVELCRAGGLTGREVIDAWFAFGEDAEVVDAGEGGWKSGPEIALFADVPADRHDRNWRALDPRDDTPDEEDEE
ncbi:MAG: hypothetical protein NT133_05715 [Alphaproteobacteria bacterium]|nr:hypothetical protein [Alphaproteobacteria bacterium]